MDHRQTISGAYSTTVRRNKPKQPRFRKPPKPKGLRSVHSETTNSTYLSSDSEDESSPRKMVQNLYGINLDYSDGSEDDESIIDVDELIQDTSQRWKQSVSNIPVYELSKNNSSNNSETTADHPEFIEISDSSVYCDDVTLWTEQDSGTIQRPDAASVVSAAQPPPTKPSFSNNKNNNKQGRLHHHHKTKQGSTSPKQQQPRHSSSSKPNTSTPTTTCSSTRPSSTHPHKTQAPRQQQQTQLRPIRNHTIVLQSARGVQRRAVFEGLHDGTSGHGTLVFETGDVYVGDILNNQLHGYGTYTFRSKNKVLTGTFQHNVYIG